MDQTALVAWLAGFSAIATALVTGVLAWFTAVLARETRRMADAGSQPQVVATIETSRWAFQHVDLVVTNSGSSTAFDIEVSFTPPLQQEWATPDTPMPFQRLSVLRPGQVLNSHIGAQEAIQNAAYVVVVKWARVPGGALEELRYSVRMSDYHGLAQLGSGDPAVAISQTLKKFRDDWAPVARGSRHVSVDMFDRQDRNRRQREMEEWRAGRTQPVTAQSEGPEVTDADPNREGGTPGR